MIEIKVGDKLQRVDVTWKSSKNDDDDERVEKIKYSEVLCILEGVALLSQETDEFDPDEYNRSLSKAGSWKTNAELSSEYKIVKSLKEKTI